MDDHTHKSNENPSDYDTAVGDESPEQNQQRKEPQTEQSLLEDEADPEQAREKYTPNKNGCITVSTEVPEKNTMGTAGYMRVSSRCSARRFFISTLLSIPVLLYSEMLQKWLGLARQGTTDPLSLLPAVSVSEVRHFSVTETI